MNIFIQAMRSGKTVQLSCAPDYTVEHVKADFQEKEGILPDQFKLIFAGKALEDGKTLSDCGIGDGATLNLIFRQVAGRRFLVGGLQASAFHTHAAGFGNFSERLQLFSIGSGIDGLWASLEAMYQRYLKGELNAKVN